MPTAQTTKPKSPSRTTPAKGADAAVKRNTAKRVAAPKAIQTRRDRTTAPKKSLIAKIPVRTPGELSEAVFDPANHDLERAVIKPMPFTIGTGEDFAKAEAHEQTFIKDHDAHDFGKELVEQIRREKAHRFDHVDIALAVSATLNVVLGAWLASIVW